jgi:hypothetical protein
METRLSATLAQVIRVLGGWSQPWTLLALEKAVYSLTENMA